MNVKGHAYVYTIGCQMNVYDSEKLGWILKTEGFDPTPDLDQADIVVCNTCSVRHKAEEKAFSFLGRLAALKKKKPALITVMAGCVAQQEGEKAFERVPHLNIVLGTRAFSRFGGHVAAVLAGRSRIVDIDEDARGIYESPPDTQAGRGSKVSRFVTIMQGCENFCTYCVVPYVRGRERSRDPWHIVEEITLLAASGVREVTLLGQNVNSYGRGLNGISFPELLREINDVQGIRRIRFATSHPKDLSMELIHAIRDLEKVCNHLHLPVQSGSDAILKKMNRGYTREDYLNRISDLKAHCPDIALSTDIIVGFPSESPGDFNDTMDLLKAVEYDAVFAFAYSNRSSAPAARFPDQIDEPEKSDRLNRLLALQEGYTERKNRDQVGKTLEILVEGTSSKERDGFDQYGPEMRQMTGRSESNKIVHFPSADARAGDFVRVSILEAHAHSLWGIPEPETKLEHS